ncbi:MAG: manganese efflux pump MntP family protein [Clostridia bacterium]
MSLIEIILIAIGLSMDAFAVAMCRGLSMRKFNLKLTLQISFCFGFFQSLMPFLGYLIGNQFEKYINAYAHYVAFVLLAFIGIKMFVESFKKDDENVSENLNLLALIIMGIATSIDALAVGVSFAVLQNIKIIHSVILIGSITFILSIIAVIVGMKFGSKFKNKGEAVGGIILFGIGLKILIEHFI